MVERVMAPVAQLAVPPASGMDAIANQMVRESVSRSIVDGCRLTTSGFGVFVPYSR